MISIRLKVGALVLPILVAAVSNVRSQDAETYKVYDAVVRAMFRDGITQFDMNAKVDQIVIRERTHSAYGYRSDAEMWKQVKMGLPDLSDEIIADYESARKNETNLKSKLDIPFSYVFITEKQLGKIFPGHHQSEPALGYWTNFYKIYPKSAGYNSFSRVGFDKARRNALVYFVNWCGTRCGIGTYLLVTKGEAGWQVKRAAGIWISENTLVQKFPDHIIRPLLHLVVDAAYVFADRAEKDQLHAADYQDRDDQ